MSKSFFTRVGSCCRALFRFARYELRCVLFRSVHVAIGLILSAATLSLHQPAHAVAPLSDAEWVVAVARFVEWPNTALRDLVVCSPPSGVPLMLDNKFVRGLRIVEKRIKNVSDVSSCHMLALFSERNPGRWIESTRGLPILTIGHGREFCIYGGIVCIVGAGSGAPARHSVNLETLARAGLYARNELLIPQGAQARSNAPQ
jgi:YfiR/HmsC-like